MITVRALIEFEELGMRAIAGDGGLQRPIRWAHVSELEDPTPWLDGGELLMTTGIGIPRTSARQVAYVQRLVDVDVAGIAIGDNMHAPPLSPAMLDTAHAADFPVVLVTREIPFIALAKTVAAANRDAMLKRLSTHLRVYETLHQVARDDADPVRLFERLAEVTGYRLFLLTPSGEPLFAGMPSFAGCAETDIAECLARPAPTPLQVQENEAGDTYLVPIVARQRRVGVLAAVADCAREPDQLVLHHIATVASLAAVELLHERERRRRDGSERLLRFVMDPANYPGGLVSLFEPTTTDDRVSFAAIRLDGPYQHWDDLHHPLSEASCRHVLGRRGRLGYVVALTKVGRDDEFASLLAKAMPDVTIGLSRQLDADTAGDVGLHEASAALRYALFQGMGLCKFDPDLASTFPLLESAALTCTVTNVLGRLLDYDERAGTDLYRTLKLFLERDRNLKATSSELSIHRQTLFYRLKRIEEITERSMSSTEDLCNLWLAVRAREALLATVDTGPSQLLTNEAA